jgi:hypothetical protein
MLGILVAKGTQTMCRNKWKHQHSNLSAPPQSSPKYEEWGTCRMTFIVIVFEIFFHGLLMIGFVFLYSAYYWSQGYNFYPGRGVEMHVSEIGLAGGGLGRVDLQHVYCEDRDIYCGTSPIPYMFVGFDGWDVDVVEGGRNGTRHLYAQAWGSDRGSRYWIDVFVHDQDSQVGAGNIMSVAEEH